MEIDFRTKNSEIVKKSEFFYALVARFCSLLYCFVWLGCCTCFNEKTTLVLESGFGIFVFVRFADSINCQIVKWLKSPNGANIAGAELTGVVLIATGEILEPRVGAVELRRTPIVAIRKTTNH